MMRAVWNDAILDSIGFECSNAHPMAGTVRAIALCLGRNTDHRFRALGTTDYARSQYVAEREQQGQHTVQAHTPIPLDDPGRDHGDTDQKQHERADLEHAPHHPVAHAVAPLPAVAVVAVVCVMTASFNEGECMGASVDVATWVSVGCAAVSAVFAGVTVWWPWHTRPAPDLRHEKDEFSVTRESMAHLLVTCGLQRPRLLVRWRNDGDGTAYAVTVKAADGSCAVRMAVPDTSKPSGFDFVDSVGKMEPGESFEAIILPTSTEDVDKPVVLLDWKESPTRLRMGHGSERVALPYRLPGKRPLLRQERILALHMIQTTAAEYGYPYEQFASQMLGIDLEDLDPWSAPDSKSKTESPDSGE